MKAHTSLNRTRTGRPHLVLECLEARNLLSGTASSPLLSTDPTGGAALVGPSAVLSPFLSVLTTDPTTPAPGSTLAASPTSVTVHFDRPIDPTSMGGDVFIEQGTSPANLTPVTMSAPLTETVDATGTGLVVGLPQSLPSGHYWIVLSGVSSLAGTDGSFLNLLGDEPLGDFTIAPSARVTLAGATHLGTPGTSPLATSGSLDLQTNPLAVALYKFTLPAGKFWQVGAELDAQAIGSPLYADLSLFDAQGHLIATSTLGRPNTPNDPYLFTGLAGGTYYIGVSSANNVPGTAGAYNPATGSAGSDVATQLGGAFTLRLVADPTKPTRVLSFQVDHADPLSTAPTGFTLSFSAALSLAMAQGQMAGTLSQAVQVVDAQGRVWPITAVGYSEANAQLSYVFNAPLPAGQYFVRLAGSRSLVDLAGQAPTAPGLLTGLLGTFRVQAGAGSTNPNDVGALLPSLASAGVMRTTALAPGGITTYQFVVVTPGQYILQARLQGSGLVNALINGPGQLGPVLNVSLGGSLPLTSTTTSPDGSLQTTVLNLSPGVYTLQIKDAGPTSATVQWTVSGQSTGAESLLDAGVGQGSALDLRLIAPSLPSGSSSGSSGSSPTQAPAGPVTTPGLPSGPVATVSPAGAGSSAAGTVAVAPGAGGLGNSTAAPGASDAIAPGAVPPGLTLTLGGTPVGQPNSGSEMVQAVGPGINGSSVALAFNGPGIMSGLNPGRGETFLGGDPTAAPGDEPFEQTATPRLTAPGPATVPVPIAAVAPGSDQPDAGWGWLDRVLSSLFPELDVPPSEAPAPDASDAVALAAVNPDQQALEAEAEETPSTGSPVGAVAVSLLVLHSRQRLQGWLGRSRTSRTVPRPRASAPRRRPAHRPQPVG